MLGGEVLSAARAGGWGEGGGSGAAEEVVGKGGAEVLLEVVAADLGPEVGFGEAGRDAEHEGGVVAGRGGGEGLPKGSQG